MKSHKNEILIFGKFGQIGHWLLKTTPKPTTVLAVDFPEIDFMRPHEVIAFLDRYRPETVINAVAFTSVDQAEDPNNRDIVFQINAKTPSEIARWCAQSKSRLIHYSTDYVYDGRKSSSYLETDACNPLNIYGESKLMGDEQILSLNPSSIILRTSWVYSTIGKNFFLTMRALARERDKIQVVSDQVGSPSYARTLAENTWKVLEASFEEPRDHFGGVYHFVSPDQTSWYEFAKEIFLNDPSFDELKCKMPSPISSAEFSTKTKRPHNSRLDTSKLQKDFNILLPAWRDQLARAYADLGANV